MDVVVGVPHVGGRKFIGGSRINERHILLGNIVKSAGFAFCRKIGFNFGDGLCHIARSGRRKEVLTLVILHTHNEHIFIVRNLNGVHTSPDVHVCETQFAVSPASFLELLIDKVAVSELHIAQS
ncbi:hypothetical protein SDC9_114210 [bioreactor metagenome]|uniref:Uncharacterized protein n=1 Tax=bioreactor metagenome TaxID=1076179 RepID=A0A645BQA2_9ZZZZ